MLISPRIACACALAAVSVTASAADSPAQPRLARIESIFQPFQTERAALAPDGRHLAYELRRDERLFLVIVNLTNNQAIELPLIADETIPLSGVSEKVPARLTGLSWPTADRVIAVVQDELLFGVDADGRNFKALVEFRDLNFVTEAARKQGEIIRPPPRIMGGYDVSEPDFTDAEKPRGLQLAQAERAGLATQTYEEDSRSSAISTHTDLGDPMSADLFNSLSGAGVVPAVRTRLSQLLPDNPEEVLIEALSRAGPWDDAPTLEGEPSVNAHNIITALARVNIRTGKITWWDGDFATSRMLADRHGNRRLNLQHFRTDRTFTVAARPGERWSNLDELAADTNLPPFGIKSGNFFGPRAIPLGFGYEPNLLYYASNAGRDTFGLYAFDLTTRQTTELAIEHAEFDLVDINEALPEQTLVFDRHRRELVGVRFEGLRGETVWLDPELKALQTRLSAIAPPLDFQVLEWDAERTRFLILATSPSEPGAYYIYDRAAGRLGEYVRRAPWITAGLSSTTSPFTIRTDAGTRLHCYFTYPSDRRIDPVPVLVYCHDGPWSRDRPGYDRGAQALASMGFAVLQVNYRGSSGFGRAHLDALRESGDRVALDDIIAALDAVQATHAVARKRVAILGNGYGGTLALRALQEHPDRFRCAVSINAPTHLPVWLNQPPQPFSFARDVRKAFFGEDEARLRAQSPVTNPGALTRPLLIVQSRSDTVVPESQARALRRALAGESSIEPEYLELPYEGHARWLPSSYVTVFNRLEEFFKTNIFEFAADAGEATVVD